MKLKVAKIQWNKKLKLMVKDKYIILSNVEIEKKSSKTEPPWLFFIAHYLRVNVIPIVLTPLQLQLID